MRSILVAMLVLLSAPAAAQPAGVQMPDPKQMSGVPLPTAELPVGTLTVRLVRGSLSNPIRGYSVEITGDVGASGTTDDNGRATFPNLRPGAVVAARAVVDGEKLESQQITVPREGGVRVMLVATDPEAAKRAEEDRKLAAGPAQRGIVVLGDQSRLVFEHGDEGLNVFHIFQILNTSRVPVEPIVPVSFVLPEGAEHAAILEGSTPLATLAAGRVDVKAPLPPGVTLVQFAYTLPYDGGSLTIRQTLPVQLSHLTVVAQKAGDMRLASDQIAQQREMTTAGQTYILGQGPPVSAGSTLEFRFTGLPHAATWPRNLALALAIGILAAGVFVSVRKTNTTEKPTPSLAHLHDKREKLFVELTSLEEDHRVGRVTDAEYQRRRQRLVTDLERVYSALDDDRAA